MPPPFRRVLLRVQPLLLLAGFGFMGLLLVQQWESLRQFEWQPSIGWLAASGLLVVGGWCIEIRLWQRLLLLLGGQLNFSTAIGIWFASSIVRYVPGNVWQPLSMTVLCRARNIRPEVTLASTLLFHAVHMLAVAVITAGYVAIPGRLRGAQSAVFGSLSGWWAAALAAPVIVFLVWPSPVLKGVNTLLVRYGRSPLPSHFSTGELVRLFGICLASWLLVCAGFAALIRALGLLTDASFPDMLIQLGAAYPAAYAIGFLSFVTPGGLAVREGVLVLLLEPLLGGGQALIVALSMRVWEIGLEIVVGGSIVGLGRATRPSSDENTPS